MKVLSGSEKELHLSSLISCLEALGSTFTSDQSLNPEIYKEINSHIMKLTKGIDFFRFVESDDYRENRGYLTEFSLGRYGFPTQSEYSELCYMKKNPDLYRPDASLTDILTEVERITFSKTTLSEDEIRYQFDTIKTIYRRIKFFEELQTAQIFDTEDISSRLSVTRLSTDQYRISYAGFSMLSQKPCVFVADVNVQDIVKKKYFWEKPDVSRLIYCQNNELHISPDLVSLFERYEIHTPQDLYLGLESMEGIKPKICYKLEIHGFATTDNHPITKAADKLFANEDYGFFLNVSCGFHSENQSSLSSYQRTSSKIYRPDNFIVCSSNLRDELRQTSIDFGNTRIIEVKK